MGDSHGSDFLIQSRKLTEVCDGWSDWLVRGLHRRGFAPIGAAVRGWGSGSAVAGAGGDPGRRQQERGGEGWGGTLQIVRDGVIRFNAEGPDGLISRKAPGKVPILNDDPRRALARTVEAGPIPAAHGAVRWRLVDLAQWICDEFGLSITKQTLSREIRRLGFRKLSARPRHHGQKDDAIADFKKASQVSWQR